MGLKKEGSTRTPRRARSLGRAYSALAAACLLAAAGALCPADAGPVVRPDALVEFTRPDGATAAVLVAELAETPEARAVGLMGRVLPDHTGGMLFVFERAEPQVFWMRNTPTSLDIIFIDAHGKVLNIAARTTPLSERTYSSVADALYVVEAKAGFAARHGIREGYVMRWKRIAR